MTDVDSRLSAGAVPAANAVLSRTGRLALGIIRVYQVTRGGHLSPCRFTPSCSEYGAQAISRYGTRRGVALLARRLVRCRPGGPFGYDPVPPASE